MRRFVGATAFVLLFLSTPSLADTIFLKEGGVMRGKVLTIGENSLTLSLDAMDGATVKLPLSRISDFGLYRIKRLRIDRDSAKDREGLGDWALKRGMFTIAMEEYKAGIALLDEDQAAPLRRKFAEAAVKCSEDKFDRGESLVSQGKLGEARAFFRDIIESHPLCPAAKVAKGRVALLDAEIKRQREVEKSALKQQLAEEATLGNLKTVEEFVARGDRMRKLGHLASGSLGHAENDFQAAVSDYERARETLAEVIAGSAAETGTQAMRDLQASIGRKLGGAYVDLGHNFILKGNLLKANRYMGLALAIDPNDPKALALRSAIAAASANDGWGRSSGNR